MQCTLPSNTLSLACNSACAPFSPCLRVNGSSSSARSTKASASRSCPYECFTMNSTAPERYNRFVFLVPFGGAWKSPQELAHNFIPEDTKAPNNTKTYASASNAELQQLAPLVLPSKTTTVKIHGGSTLDSQTIKGRVVNVALAPALLSNQTQVLFVSLANVRLEPFTDTLVAMFPRTLTILVLNNGLLTRVPPGLAQLKRLRTLNVNRNYLTAIDARLGADLPSLTAFGANKNGLRSFTAVFPNVTILDLAANNLTAMPTVLSQYARLQELYIDTNEITAVTASDTNPSLSKLFLSDNAITRFDAHFPNLSELSLTTNKLTAIPPAVFNLTTLHKLYLAGNPLVNVTLTRAQAKFLSGLRAFTISTTGLYRGCAPSEQVMVQKIAFCLSDASETRSISTKAPSSSNATDATKAIDNNSSERSAQGPSVVAIAVIVTITIVLLIGIVLLYWMKTAAFRKPRTDSSASDATGSTEASSSAASIGRLWSRFKPGSSGASVSVWDDPELRALQVAVDDIDDVKQIGVGAYGDVWLVRFRGAGVHAHAAVIASGDEPVLLASKRLKQSVHPSEREEHRARSQAFISEIKLVALLQHPKIVAFVGAAWTIETDLQALFEYMGGGDLRSLLDDEQTPLAWSLHKLQIAIDVAEALVYCHGFEPPLVHRDLKSRNVLLTTDGSTAKLSDFGVSRFRSQANTMTGGVGTGRWLAPEVIDGASDYGPAADVFSFGVVLSELDTHEVPYASAMKRREIVEVALLQLIAAGELTPRLGASCPAAVADLAKRCWAVDPAQRPTAVELAYELRIAKQQLAGGGGGV